MIYNLALIPDKKFEKHLIRLSSELAQYLPSVYIIGKNSLPHCTVLQFSSNKKPRELWKKISVNTANSVIVLKPKRFYVNYSDNGNTWFGIEMKLAKGLRELHEELLNDLQSIKVHNKVHKEYFPHFTTGMIHKNKAKYIFKDKKILRMSAKCRLHLCKSGKNWTADKILY